MISIRQEIEAASIEEQIMSWKTLHTLLKYANSADT
jgi:hypothetical protein